MITLALAILLAGGLQSPTASQAAAGPSDFDFLKGRWNVVYNNTAPGIPPNLKGAWVAEEQADGRVLYDEFRVFGPNGQTVTLGVTYRIFDHGRGRWDMRYAAVLAAPPGEAVRMPAQWAELTAWRDGHDMCVDQVSAGRRLRIRYYNITPDHFSWKADVSTDGGKTWSVDQIKIEATRVKEPVAGGPPSPSVRSR